MDELLLQFERHWADFAGALRGNMSRMKKLSFQEAALALDTAKMDWIARDTVYGRWFMKLEKENPQIAKQVERILTMDMKFADDHAATATAPLVQYAVPAAGAAVAGVSHHLIASAATLLSSAAVTIVAAGVLFVGVKQFTENRNKALMQKALDAYMAQLTLYRDSVIAALKAA